MLNNKTILVAGGTGFFWKKCVNMDLVIIAEIMKFFLSVDDIKHLIEQKM